MRTITMIRSLSLALGLYALISSSVAQRLDWLGPIEVRGVTNSGLVIGKAADIRARFVPCASIVGSAPSWGARWGQPQRSVGHHGQWACRGRLQHAVQRRHGERRTRH
jgi:hypothetical protein